MIYSLNERLDSLVVILPVFSDYFAEVAFGVIDKIFRGVELPDFPLFQNHYSVVVDNSVQSVGNCDYSGVSELLPNHLLNQEVSFLVDVRSRLNYFSLLRPSTKQAIS
jgi:hypothetical protein